MIHPAAFAHKRGKPAVAGFPSQESAMILYARWLWASIGRPTADPRLCLAYPILSILSITMLIVRQSGAFCQAKTAARRRRWVQERFSGGGQQGCLSKVTGGGSAARHFVLLVSKHKNLVNRSKYNLPYITAYFWGRSEKLEFLK